MAGRLTNWFERRALALCLPPFDELALPIFIADATVIVNILSCRYIPAQKIGYVMSIPMCFNDMIYKRYAM